MTSEHPIELVCFVPLPDVQGDIPAPESSLPWCMIQNVAGPTDPRLSTS